MASLETLELLRTPTALSFVLYIIGLPALVHSNFKLLVTSSLFHLIVITLIQSLMSDFPKHPPIKSLLCFQFSFWFPSACRIYFELFSEACRTLYDLDPIPCPPSVPSIHHSRWTHWLEVSWITRIVPSLCVYAHVIFTGCKIINFLISLKRIELE